MILEFMPQERVETGGRVGRQFAVHVSGVEIAVVRKVGRDRQYRLCLPGLGMEIDAPDDGYPLGTIYARAAIERVARIFETGGRADDPVTLHHHAYIRAHYTTLAAAQIEIAGRQIEIVDDAQARTCPRCDGDGPFRDGTDWCDTCNGGDE